MAIQWDSDHESNFKKQGAFLMKYGFNNQSVYRKISSYIHGLRNQTDSTTY